MGPIRPPSHFSKNVNMRQGKLGRNRQMLAKPESACFVIADISGCTSFLHRAELDHAQDIVADVMDTVLRRLRPPFRLDKFEGDGAFVYAVVSTHTPILARSNEREL
jgi:class 3 adenylate cyclase